MARLDRQVGRLERAAALLVDDVERADEPDVVDEVRRSCRLAGRGRGRVTNAGPPTALKTTCAAAEDDVALRVAGVERELARRGRRSAPRPGAGSSRTRRVSAGRRVAPARRERVERPVAEDLDADLREDPQRGAMDRLDLVGGQDLERPERVDQASPRELPDPGRTPSRATAVRLGRRGIGGDGVGVDRVHRPDATAPDRPLRAVPRPSARGRADLIGISDTGRGMDTTAALPRPRLRDTERDGMKLKILAVVVLGAVGVGAAVVRHGRAPANAASATEYLTSAATTGDVTDDVAATGSVSAAETLRSVFGPRRMPRRCGRERRGHVHLDRQGRHARGRRHRQGGRRARDGASADLSRRSREATASWRSARIQLTIAKEQLADADVTDTDPPGQDGVYNAQNQVSHAAAGP